MYDAGMTSRFSVRNAAMVWSASLFVGACSSRTPAPATNEPARAQPGSVATPTTPAAVEPSRLAFGACAGPDTRFVSGPRPMPFDPRRWQGRNVHVDELPPGLGDPRSWIQTVPEPYEPDRHNRLRAQSDELAACLGGEPTRHGVAVVDLEYDDARAVGRATVHGNLAPATKDCIATISKQVRARERTRCSFAYGTLAIGDAPGIDLAGTTIAWHGTRIATDTQIIEPLRNAIVGARRASSEPVVVEGPIVIRPTDATPMRVVNDTMRSLVAAGERNFVFAARRGPAWASLITELELPVVPVPVGTGAPWMHPELGGPIQEVDEPHLELSMYVTADTVIFRVSKINLYDQVESSHGVHDWTKVAEKLLEHKRYVWFRERTDIQIAGSGDVPYAAVVAAIERARNAGFTRWSLVPPEELATPTE
jgi:hypothetical protein